MSLEKCTPAPPLPPNPSSDWTDVVLGNCFRNIERLGLWTGGQKVIQSRHDPSGSFSAVAPGSLGGGATPPTIYVVVHGWAPGYRAMVNSQGGNVLWWGKNASVNGAWASDWAWSPVSAPLVPAASPVNATGMVQSIVAQDAKAAAAWFEKAASAGYRDSAFDLAVLYERGEGVAQNSREALKWYEQAASFGDPEAMQRATYLRSWQVAER